MNAWISSRVSWLCGLLWLLSLPAVAAEDAADAAANAAAISASERFFENQVRPVLLEHCAPCHGEEQEAGLRVDSLQGLLTGGDSGPAVVPGDAASSLVIQAIRHQGGLEMPPDEPLEPQQIDALVAWVNGGAYWPASDRRPGGKDAAGAGSSHAGAAEAAAADEHWAFQAVAEPPVPVPERSDWVRTAVDAFVLARLEAADLEPSPEADRRTLIRRASYAVTGLPPSPEETEEFIRSSDPQAYEHLIERLLDSPRYGEHWTRHWLDVARYSDTKGYVYAREERFWVHAWAYRDWVVAALNQDLPYDRFLMLQIAADQVEDREQGDLAAMGFLTLGRRFLGVEHDIIDDRIDVVTRGTMGLTVGCARCHNHKYDPIPTADYYSLYGVFDSSAERVVPLAEPEPDSEFARELETRRQKLASRTAESRAEFSALARRRVGEYLRAQTELEKYPNDGFDQILQKDDLLPALVRRWDTYLRSAKHRGDPVFAAWHAYRDLATAAFAEEAVAVTEQLQNSPESAVNREVLAAFETPPQSFGEVVDRYAALLGEVESRWQTLVKDAAASGGDSPVGLADPAAEKIRRVLYGTGSPCEVPDEPIVHTEDLFDSATCTELWKLQGDVDRWIIAAELPIPYALTLVDRPVPVEPRIFRRGNPANKGAEVPRQFLEILSGESRQPFQKGSGRYELAAAIASPTNPLTARVLVNRVWTHHFGQGLVSTPSDFGTRAEKPSHPELLDYLAARFVAEGWSLKKLHRWILLSSTFRQASKQPNPSESWLDAERVDPQNRLLWRMNPHRLSFEEFRDSLLTASRALDLEIGGKPVEMFTAPYPARRSLYGLVDRQFLPTSLRVFDFANPDLHIPQRSETTVPQQSLFFLNHPLVIEHAKKLASGADVEDESAAIEYLFERVLQREPSSRERREALELVRALASEPSPKASLTAKDWQYGYGEFDAASERVADFQPLPHFTGTAWQGSPAWPDPKLGWVQLTAEGGHPGNDRKHASIRRWTAPRSMAITLRSHLKHEAAAGDGIRAFVVSSRAGRLKDAEIHQQEVELTIDRLDVEAGETIDFVVDIGNVLNSDQYVWKIQLEALVSDPGLAAVGTSAASEPRPAWDSSEDFVADHVQRLSAWEQLAQILLCTNEFLFVD
ncbi:PSD1 and planctomycete cytochrome C domain-containing protein [Candidatus Laterigemmans baculatus]|uniref:PSD1 and planctomycete cytochrome C domain-containing protein n=1 Tax=Candidatus Laterigemmans baculatus TaxID=2770505 RepID=UPI001F3A41D2|nr:PSD1 and planctomycete cytochrome C domain-containing protein [Candidatus Laterigemmans baculatus]